MKIRLVVNDDKYNKIKLYLEKLGIDVDEVDFDYSLVENNHKINKIIGTKQENLYLIKPIDIIYFESFGNDVVCHTIDNKLIVKYKLYELENHLEESDFMRVSNSFIINLNMIKSITPTINRKFILIMKNDNKVQVTRSYYYKFKEFIERW